MKEKLVFALDYDKTYTACPDIWLAFIDSVRAAGHNIYCVTMRYEDEGEDVERQLKGKVDKIIYTGRKGKLRHMNFLGITVDIWIDDCPRFIFSDGA